MTAIQVDVLKASLITWLIVFAQKVWVTNGTLTICEESEIWNYEKNNYSSLYEIFQDIFHSNML